jgi:hypothetical protein
MNDRESRGVTLLTGTAQGPGRTGRQAASCSGADRAQRASRVGNCSSVPRPDVADIVDMVALGQRRDAAALSRVRRNTQQQVTVRQRLVVDRQGRFVVTEPLKARTIRPRSPW